jgi:hypothetical protein
MIAKAILTLTMLVVAIRPLAAEPMAAHRCEIAPAAVAGETSASICQPLDSCTKGGDAAYFYPGTSDLGDIMGGRDSHARELAKLAHYAGKGDRTQVEILSRELLEFGMSDEDVEGAKAQSGPRRHPSAATNMSGFSAPAGGW